MLRISSSSSVCVFGPPLYWLRRTVPVALWPRLIVSPTVQIFGIKGSQSTRAAERFFKERGITVHLVDLEQKPMSAGEIRRFIERFGLVALLDTESKAYVKAGLKYLKVTDQELLARIEREPRLLRLPLVRSAKSLSMGRDENAWKEMLAG